MLNVVALGRQTTALVAGDVPTTQMVLASLESPSNVKIVQHHGVATAPPVGAKHVVIFVGGDRSNGFSVGTLVPGAVPVTDAGESGLYAYNTRIRLRSGGIEITSDQPVSITAPSVTITGDLVVTGTVTAGPAGATVGLTTHHHPTTTSPVPGT